MSEVKTNKITSLASNNDITLDPDGTGDVVVASGNVGIGTSSPSNLLTLQSNSSTKLNIRHTASGNDYGYIFRTTGATTNDLIVESEVNGASTERMRIDSSGNVGIGTGSPSFTSGNGLHLADNYFAGFGSGASGRPDFQIGTVGGSTLDFRCGTGSDTVDLSISTGGLFTGDFNDTSDERLKENIQDIAANQIDVVKQLRPVTFDWKAAEKGTNTGFIAQEVMALLPNDVQRSNPDDENSTLGINSMALVATLTGALQEAIAKIEALETSNADLEARVTALENA